MHVLLFLLLFEFALPSVIEDSLPIISINVIRGEHEKFLAVNPQNYWVINFPDYFKIMVYMPKQVKKEILCFEANNSNTIIRGNLSEDGEGYSTFQKATADMATEWRCELNTKLSKFFTRPFKVHVRGQKPTLLYINKNNIKKDQANYRITDYDEYAYHTYIDGEIVGLKYDWYRVDSSSSLSILYWNKDEQFSIDYRENVLYLKLTKEYNNNYLDCILTEKTVDGVISSVLRVIFQMKIVVDVPRFVINDMVLTQVSQSNLNVTFVYYYYNHENVIIRTPTESSSSLKCSNGKNPSQIVNGINLNTTLTKNNNELELSCIVKDNRFQNDTVMTLMLKYVISQRIISQKSDFDRMTGLSWANVLAKYRSSNGDVVIKYAYRGERLLLTCYALDTGMIWNFELNQINYQNVSNGQFEYTGKFWDTKLFELKHYYNRTTIKCYENDQSCTKLELIRVGTLQFGNIPETDIDKYFDSTGNNNDIIISPVAPSTEIENEANDGVTVASTSSPTDITTKLNEQYDIEDEGNKDEESFLKKIPRLLLICGPVIVATVLIAIIVCVIMKRFKQKRVEQANSSDINYENLPEHNDGPMPIPKQWQCEDDVTYSIPDVDKCIDNLYAKPLPKALRPSKTTLIYAEAFDHTNRSGADYVNTGRFVKRIVEEGKDDSNYAEVYQSNVKASSNSKMDHVNETYAQVEPKVMRHYENLNITDDQSSNLYSEPAYAEIK